MHSYNVRPLLSTDAESLLKFEVENREWFETHIDPRAPSFYSLQGVKEHIQSYLDGLAAGSWQPFVIEDGNGQIVGRANLKDINLPLGSAEVGYRIARHACGQGLATLALKHLIVEAKSRWQLTQLIAEVYEENSASRKVLERCGFSIEDKAVEDRATHPWQFILSIRALTTNPAVA
jgi:ribosomal-protein-alanine N-acetyltransferase